MPSRIILVIILLTLIVLPITGSSGIPWNTVPATMETTETTPQVHVEANPAPSDKSASPAPEEQPDKTVAGALSPLPEESSSEQEENDPPASQNDDDKTSVEEVQDEEQVVIADSFPSPDMCIWEYTVFKNEVLAIIDQAERSSGIKTVYGVFVLDLVNNYSCGVNENLTRIDPYDNMEEGYFNSASVIKLFQGYILCDMMRRGELNVDEVYYDSVTGRRFKLLRMIRDMISYSDNNYSNAALRLIGNQKSNEVLNRLGIHEQDIWRDVGGDRLQQGKQPEKVWHCQALCPDYTRDTGLILYNIYINRENDIYGNIEQGSHRQYLQHTHSCRSFKGKPGL